MNDNELPHRVRVHDGEWNPHTYYGKPLHPGEWSVTCTHGGCSFDVVVGGLAQVLEAADGHHKEVYGRVRRDLVV
jgi:hypothetical protein